MSKVAALSLYAYLGALAVTQTVYGSHFMSARWFTLGILVIASGFHWFSAKPSAHDPSDDKSNLLTLIYFAMTFLTIVGAENPLFSGMKWISHTLMLLIFLVFLRQSLKASQVNPVLLFLKGTIVTLLIASWMKPASLVSSLDVQLYRGAFGSPNSMGQVAAIGALLLIHGALTGKIQWLRYLEASVAALALWLTWSSGARSAIIAFLTGIVLMNYFYRARLSKKTIGITLLMAFLMVTMPDLPKSARLVLLRGERTSESFSEQIFKSRKDVWEASWEGFQKRPFLGWGFGADDTMSKEWNVQFTALGTVSRDNVNDTMIMLESTGIVGLMAYLLLILVALKQIPTRNQRWILYQPSFSIPSEIDLSLYHTHAITYILATSLIVTVQFDNTALSAGNFISVVLWLCVAVSGAIKREARGYEQAWLQYYSLADRYLRLSTANLSQSYRIYSNQLPLRNYFWTESTPGPRPSGRG
jgi:O-antigen ligase